MATFKGLELAVIVGLIGWFYMKERNNLARLKAEREAKKDDEGGGSGT